MLTPHLVWVKGIQGTGTVFATFLQVQLFQYTTIIFLKCPLEVVSSHIWCAQADTKVFRRAEEHESPISEQQMSQQEESIVAILFSSKQKSLFPGNVEEAVGPLLWEGSCTRRRGKRPDRGPCLLVTSRSPRRPPRAVLLPTLPGRGALYMVFALCPISWQ